MTRMKFANIVMEPNARTAGHTQLYCRSELPFSYDPKAGVGRMAAAGRYDFTTYFNALSVAKLLRCTSAARFTLHLELAGAACTLSQTGAYRFSREPSVIAGRSVTLGPSESWRGVELDLEVGAGMVLAGFIIDSSGPLTLRSGFYEIETADELRDVELAVATTTFRKERYISRNIELVRERILDTDEELADHLHLHVVDNGRTLDAAALSGPGVTVHPNDNVGGAGGFARGMIEALGRTPRATHVVLMDDDVSISPESLLRTYALLRIVRDEYAEALISGAMFNYEIGEQQLEDVGWLTPAGEPEPLKPALNMGQLADCVLSEQFRIRDDQRPSMYAGWWYCCVPASIIDRVGFPLPVFVRFDDIEYGIRAARPIITMNGICIWHEPFKSKYSAAVERYQTTRNALIAQATAGMAPDVDFPRRLRRILMLDLKKYDYDDAELALRGFEDFLEGPAALSEPGAVEARFVWANRNAERQRPLEELRVDAEAIEGFDLDAVTRQDLSEELPEVRSIRQRAVDLVSGNHQRWPFYGREFGYGLITAAGWVYPAAEIRNRRWIVAIDWRAQTGAIRRKDPARFGEIERRFKRDLAFYRRHATRLSESYREARSELVSLRFWKCYLGLCRDGDA